MHIPVGYSQINLKFIGTGVPNGAEVTFGVANGSALTAHDIADLLASNYSTNLAPAAPNQVRLGTILVKNGPNATGQSAELGVAVDGENAVGDLLPSTCALVRKVTNSGGRHARGRMFLPFLGETDVENGGTVRLAFLTGLQSSLQAFLTQLGEDAVPMYLLHADALTAPMPVIALNVQPLVATQRRRLRR